MRLKILVVDDEPEVAEVIAEKRLDAKLFRVGLAGFAESGKAPDLFRKYRMDADAIAEKIITGLEELKK